MELALLAGAAAAGPLIDRFDPRRVLLGAELAAVPAALLLILPDSLPALIAAVVLYAALNGVSRTASASFAPYLTADAGGLGRVNASLEVATSAAHVAGAGLAAVLAGIAGVTSVFVFDAANPLAAVLLVGGVVVRRIDAAAPQGGGLRELSAGLRAVAALPVLRYAVALGSLVFLAEGFFGVFEPLFFRDVLGEGVAVLGAVNAVFGVGMLAGATAARRVLAGGSSARLVTLLVLASGAGACGYAAFPDARIVALGGVAWGFVVGLWLPALRTLIQASTPGGVVGRVMGVLGVTESAGSLLPALTVGALGLRADAQVVLVGSGLALMAAAATALPLGARLDRGTFVQEGQRVTTASEVWDALEEGDADALERLLRRRPELAGSRDPSGVSLLLRTRYRARHDLAAVVLAANPPLDGYDSAALDAVDRLDEILIADPEFTRKRAGDGFTALHLAAFFRADRAAARLLDAGADPGAVADNALAVQPLHSAVAGRATRVARLLLERHADPDARAAGGFTPLHGAANAGSAELVRLLLSAGATRDLPNDDGVTPVDLAVQCGHSDVADLLRA